MFHTLMLCAVIATNYVEGCIPPPPADLATLKIILTWYDPKLEGHNCDHDCRYLATNILVEEHLYYTTAACIDPWLGGHVTITGFGTYQCLDTGGLVKLRWDEELAQWVIHVDVLAHGPVYGCDRCVISHWSFSW